MKKIFKMFTLVFTLCIILTVSVFAHSGRTDKYGGHKDNKNVSGLGSYHYHCGGYPAHLHTNGICPYDTNSTASTSNSNTQSNIKTNPSTPHTTVSDIKAYVNDNFIPSFNYKDYTFIVAEDLNKCGYDVEWNDKDRTLKVAKNIEKATTSLGTKNSAKEYNIETTDIKVLLLKDATYTTLESYNIGGQTIIKVEDLDGTVDWNNNTRTIKFTTTK